MKIRIGTHGKFVFGIIEYIGNSLRATVEIKAVKLPAMHGRNPNTC